MRLVHDAIALRDELLDLAWREREAFVYEVEPLAESVARAVTLADQGGPVLLLDHYDNTASGGTMDTTEVLSEILAQKLEDVAVFGFYDPEVVAKLAAILKPDHGGVKQARLACHGQAPKCSKEAARSVSQTRNRGVASCPRRPLPPR